MCKSAGDTMNLIGGFGLSTVFVLAVTPQCCSTTGDVDIFQVSGQLLSSVRACNTRLDMRILGPAVIPFKCSRVWVLRCLRS